MPMCCANCRAASLDLTLQCCVACQSALYCSDACRTEDWASHEPICKLLNMGHVAMQVRTDYHTRRSLDRFLTGEQKRFFKLFEDSTEDGSEAATLEMSKIAKRLTKQKQHIKWFCSLEFLIHSNSEMLEWPNSPLLVLLQFVDPNVLSGSEESVFARKTLLHKLADLADPFDYSTHQIQLIVAKQLIGHGASVNAVSTKDCMTPLHRACSPSVVTNLYFVELLLEKGDDPNDEERRGETSLTLTCTIRGVPGVAKFLLNWPTTDVNIASFLSNVRSAIRILPKKVARPDNPEQVQHQFLFQQWREIEEMLVERGAADNGPVGVRTGVFNAFLAERRSLCLQLFYLSSVTSAIGSSKYKLDPL